MHRPILFAFLLMMVAACARPNASPDDAPMTYKALSKGFYLGSDNKMYIQTAWVLEDEDTWVKDKNPMFFREVPSVDIATFEELGQDGWYAKDKNHVYINHFTTDGRYIYLLDSADANSFQSIGHRWGKDKHHVFADGLILKGLHPDSMVILCTHSSEFQQGFFSLVKDNKQVFWGYQPMSDIDAKTFECIDTASTIIYRDKNYIYKENYFSNMDENDKIKR